MVFPMDEAQVHRQLRALPSVHALMREPEIVHLLSRHDRAWITAGARRILDEARGHIQAGRSRATTAEHLAAAVKAWVEQERNPALMPVVNATGVMLHTNLGRAPLCTAALEAVAQVAGGYSTLEYSLETGGRASRYAHCRQQLCQLSGAEDAIVVNNNAAAMFLILSALCSGREVLISRGQLVEIGGGFRIPDILAQSGARLVEVGTTNRTYIADFERALTLDTAAVLWVHASNFRQTGFVHQPSLANLVSRVEAYNRTHGCAVMAVHDLGSGCLQTRTAPFAAEYSVAQSVQAGAHLTAFSGDKLLGGPQAGLIVGRQTLVAHLLRHPLMRVLRMDKMGLSALSATLALYIEGRAPEEVPLLAMGLQPLPVLAERAEHLASRLVQADVPARVVAANAAAGGGSLPEHEIPSVAVALPAAQPQAWADRLRTVRPPIIVRIVRDQVLLDMRTVFPVQDDWLFQAVVACHAHEQ